MTNKDKYLKECVSVEKFVEFLKSKQPNNKFDMTFHDIALWLEAPAQPTLTKDERVILRNIKNVRSIKRDNDGDLFVYKIDSGVYYITMYNYLFQFIKERRRI